MKQMSGRYIVSPIPLKKLKQIENMLYRVKDIGIFKLIFFLSKCFSYKSVEENMCGEWYKRRQTQTIK